MIQDKVINEFVDYLFDTPPYKTQFSKNNRDGLKNVIKHLLESLYKEIPEDIINYLEVNASKYFLDLLYREAGISDYFIQRVPESLKVRVSYLLNVLNINRATQKIFSMFHEALEEFYPEMNIYTVEILPKDINNPETELIYKLKPIYITAKDSIIEEISIGDLSGTFLMRPEQFIDKEEKFSNIYPDYRSKQRIINCFPIKTGMIYIQNPSGIGVADFDDYIPLMQTIGCTLQKNAVLPWKSYTEETKKNIPFPDFIKLCTYLKFKEFQFKHKWTWSTDPLEIYSSRPKLIEWNNALNQARDNGMLWQNFFTMQERKLNNFILHDADDLVEAERLELVYKGLKRSGKNGGRDKLNQFKTDWNTLRQKAQNTDIRIISNLSEFREELIGSEPYNLKEFELLLLQKFKTTLNGEARDSLFKTKKQYQTNLNNVSAPNGLITLTLQYFSNQELNDFLMIKYGRFINLDITEEQLLYDLLQWYTTLGTIPILKHYWYLKKTKYTDILSATWKDPVYLSKAQYKSIYTEMTNNSNILNFQELSSIIKVKYRDIIENIDAMQNDPDTAIEDYVMKFLTLWKILQVDLPTDKRIRYFWNEFFMRNIMGSSFKDYFYDPILELFLEYWFPAETTTQNKDVFTILIKDKMNMIVTDSKTYSSWRINRTSSLLSKDQFKITITKKDGTIKEHSYLFSKTKENKINVLIDSNLIESTHIED